MNGACGENEFQCKNDLKCIPATKRCNGRYDCQDSTDESDCPNLEEKSYLCHNKSLYQCDNLNCIEEDLLCNGKDDCGDNSDEPINCGRFSEIFIWPFFLYSFLELFIFPVLGSG